jgi:toxin ParE1/3/4
MVTRRRSVVWTESAFQALDDVVAYVSLDSEQKARSLLIQTLDLAQSLETFSERGRVVPEIGESDIRELLVFDYRLQYRVSDTHVVLLAFLHGARDYSKWRREQ